MRWYYFKPTKAVHLKRAEQFYQRFRGLGLRELGLRGIDIDFINVKLNIFYYLWLYYPPIPD